ncbi:hypothetical protein [Phenylobacterium sp.]|jgi:hypothetical protein|nr:hypothetical protein [Phenylobacterium sp.]HEX3363916.1 hypothetical protein [Phenylobacterium sp.]
MNLKLDRRLLDASDWSTSGGAFRATTQAHGLYTTTGDATLRTR